MKIKLTIFFLAFFTSHFSFGQKVEDLNVDTTITGFRLAANFNGTLVYTPKGKADLNTINPSAFSFTIMPNATHQAALEQIEQLLNMSRQDGYKHSEIVKKDTAINGNKAYYISFTETRKDSEYKNLVFDAFYIKDDTILLFVSGDLDNGKHIENFKKTFFSTRL